MLDAEAIVALVIRHAHDLTVGRLIGDLAGEPGRLEPGRILRELLRPERDVIETVRWPPRRPLDALEELYELPEGGLKPARDVLRNNGNMSAATAMFVLAETMQDNDTGHWLMSALGPGFTATFALLEAS